MQLNCLWSGGASDCPPPNLSAATGASSAAVAAADGRADIVGPTRAWPNDPESCLQSPDERASCPVNEPSRSHAELQENTITTAQLTIQGSTDTFQRKKVFLFVLLLCLCGLLVRWLAAALLV